MSTRHSKKGRPTIFLYLPRDYPSEPFLSGVSPRPRPVPRDDGRAREGARRMAKNTRRRNERACAMCAVKRECNPTGNGDVTRIRNFFAALSRRFRGFRGAFAGFAAISRRLRAASHTAQWCLRKDSQPFRKVSQLRIRVTSPLPVGLSVAKDASKTRSIAS